MNIRPCTVDELIEDPRFAELVAGYEAECATAGLGDCIVQTATYKHLESTGLLRAVAAYAEGQLVGFVTVLTSMLPHFGKLVGTTESYYVHPDYRKGGLGAGLLRVAEAVAQDQGAVGFFVSAPAGGRLEKIMGRTAGYRHSNTVFFKGLGA